MADWRPYGSFVLVRLHTRGSKLALEGTDVEYTGIGTVLAVGPKAEGVTVGDTVLLSGHQGIVAHKQMDEHTGLIASQLLVARRVDTPETPVVES